MSVGLLSLYVWSIEGMQVINGIRAKRNESLKSKLSQAIENDDGKAVKRLILFGADKEEQVSFFFSTPLGTAASMGKLKAMRALIEAGANKDSGASVDSTPLHCAANAQQVAAVQFLIESGAQLETLDRYGRTPFLGYLEYCSDDTAVFEALMQAKVNVYAVDSEGNTGLHIVASGRSFSMVDRLVQCGLDVNAKNKKGQTPLFGTFLPEMVRVLIQAGADIHITDLEDCTPIERFRLEQESRDAKFDFFDEKQTTIDYIRALVTTVAPQEVQHIIPMLILLTLRKIWGHDVGRLIAVRLVPMVVHQKLEYACSHLPDISQDELLNDIEGSTKKALSIKRK